MNIDEARRLYKDNPKTLWDRAHKLDDWRGEPVGWQLFQYRQERALLKFCSTMRVQNGWKHLDVGTGDGHWKNFLHDYVGTSSCGIDISSEATGADIAIDMCHPGLVYAMRHYIKDSPKIVRPPYDIITAMNCLKHVLVDDELIRALRSFSEMLASSGYFIFSYLPSEEAWPMPRDPVWYRLRSTTEWEHILHEGGFRPENPLDTNCPAEYRILNPMRVKVEDQHRTNRPICLRAVRKR